MACYERYTTGYFHFFKFQAVKGDQVNCNIITNIKSDYIISMAGEYYVTSDKKCETFSLIDKILITEKLEESLQSESHGNGACVLLLLLLWKNRNSMSTCGIPISDVMIKIYFLLEIKVLKIALCWEVS